MYFLHSLSNRSERQENIPLGGKQNSSLSLVASTKLINFFLLKIVVTADYIKQSGSWRMTCSLRFVSYSSRAGEPADLQGGC